MKSSKQDDVNNNIDLNNIPIYKARPPSRDNDASHVSDFIEHVINTAEDKYITTLEMQAMYKKWALDLSIPRVDQRRLTYILSNYFSKQVVWNIYDSIKEKKYEDLIKTLEEAQIKLDEFKLIHNIED